MNDIDKLLKTGCKLSPDYFELFHAFNPNLTREVYNYLRGNRSEWKIICGFEVKIKYSKHFLEGNRDLLLANLKVYNNRFIPEYFLNPENWNNGRN